MPRVPFVAGNWKMNKTITEALTTVERMASRLEEIAAVEKAVFPPFTALPAVSEVLKDTSISVGAQNMHWEDAGAFTGEISPIMLKDICRHVILGHSERRSYFGESDEHINRKLRAAFHHGLCPIVCIGETLEEREAGRTADVVRNQVIEGLQGIAIEQASKIVLAYEPVWAIGTGRASSPEDANEVIAEIIRPTLTSMFDASVAQTIRVQYGGSVKPDNAESFFQQPDIDGALVGGASLRPDDFVDIVQAAMP